MNQEKKLMKHVDLLIERYPNLDYCKSEIISAYNILEEAYRDGRKLLVAGNGGSASDAEHIVGELMKEFRLKRKIFSAQIERLMKIDAEMGTVLADHLQGSLPAISLRKNSADINSAQTPGHCSLSTQISFKSPYPPVKN